MKKSKKVKTKSLVADTPKRKRGRPRKDEQRLGTPKSQKNIEKEMLGEIKKKRGRPRKVVVETKQETLTKIAKLGKRNYKKAVEKMAMDKISKRRMKRKGSVSNGNGDSHGEPVSVKTYSYEGQSPILAGPTKSPMGTNGLIVKEKKTEENKPILSIIDRIKNRLTDRGYVWKESTFKVIEKTPTIWTVEFIDKKQGEITSSTNVVDFKKEEKIEEEKKNAKVPKLSKVELNRYIKKLVARGLNPTNIKVIENTPVYFKIEFNDGENGTVVTCGHVKEWDV